MQANPFLGVFFHWLGGLASGSFYVPYRGVKKWAWEVYWLVGGFFSWIIAPWILASINTRDLLGVLGQTSASTFGWTWFWGAMWGLGGLTFGSSSATPWARPRWAPTSSRAGPSTWRASSSSARSGASSSGSGGAAAAPPG